MSNGVNLDKIREALRLGNPALKKRALAIVFNEAVVEARGAIEEFVETLVGQISDLKLMHKLVHAMCATALLGRCIIVGRGGSLLTRHLPGGIHVRLIAPEEFRLKGLVDRLGWTEEDARKELHERDSHRIGFFQKYLHRDSNDPENYDLVLNASRLSRDEMCEQIITLFKTRQGTK